MVGEELVIPAGLVNDNMRVTHKQEDLLLGVDDKPVIFGDEKLLIAIKASIAHSDDNFGSGVFLVTDSRVSFIGKGSIDGVISAIARAAGGGRTYIVFPLDKLAGAVQGGLLTKNCTVLSKEKGFFGGDKIVKYKVIPHRGYTQYLNDVIKIVNQVSKGK